MNRGRDSPSMRMALARFSNAAALRRMGGDFGPWDLTPLARLAASCFSEIGIRDQYGGGVLGRRWMLLILLGKILVIAGCFKAELKEERRRREQMEKRLNE